MLFIESSFTLSLSVHVISCSCTIYIYIYIYVCSFFFLVLLKTRERKRSYSMAVHAQSNSKLAEVVLIPSPADMWFLYYCQKRVSAARWSKFPPGRRVAVEAVRRRWQILPAGGRFLAKGSLLMEIRLNVPLYWAPDSRVRSDNS